MQNSENEVREAAEDSLSQNQQIQKLLFRILPYWPLIILAIILGLVGAKIYMRYATKIYAVKSRIIVNDDSQQKTSNLLDVVQQLDTRNMSTETEKEMEILKSRNLLSELANKLQLNIHYIVKGHVKSGERFKQIPFHLGIANTDSVKFSFSGSVQIRGNHIQFNNVLYPCDTFITSPYGKIKWHIVSTSDEAKNDWFVKVSTLDTSVNDLEKALTIEPISKQSSILDVTYNDAIPERGIDILSNLFSLYGTSTVNYKSRISENTLHFLDERIALISGDLGEVEKKLQNYKTNNNIVDLSEQGKAFLDQLQITDSKISELQVQLDVLNKIQQYVSARNNSNNEVPATLGISDPVLMSLLNQLYQAEFDLQKVKQLSGSKNPQIEVLEGTINKLRPSILSSVINLKTGIQTSLQQLQSDNNKLSGVLDKMPVKERQLLDISRQQAIKNDIYTFLLQKREEAAINAAGIVANYRVINDPAVDGLLKPKSQLVFITSILIFMIIITVFIYFKEFWSTKIKFRTQIEERTSVPVISEIGYQEQENENPIVIREGIRSIVAEEFRELRTNINYITFTSNEKCKIILITSSIPSEGKSFISINTSISLCLTGSKVVLLEFDLRKPKISKELGIKRNPGLTTFLVGNCDAADIVQAYPTINNFSIIPSGPIPPNPTELMSSSRLVDLIVFLKQNFDYIIIDSPPVAAVTDAKILSKHADATLYIMRQNYTDSSFIELVNDVKQKNLFPNLSIIFNGIKVKSIPGYRKYNYSYKYGYGSSEGYGYFETKKKKPWWKIFSSKNNK